VNQSQSASNYKVKFITLYGAKEGIANVFKEFCANSGIELRVTPPYISEQHGSLEQKNYTTMNLARAMILRAKAPEHLWHEAVPTAGFVSNMIVRKGQTKTPYELFFGRKPNVLPLRVWGCGAYVIINPKDRESKVSPRAEVGRFVGYSDNHKGYRVLLDDDNEDSIVESRNVVMFERVFCVDEDYNDDVQSITSGEAVWSTANLPVVYKSPLDHSTDGDDSDDDYVPDEHLESDFAANSDSVTNLDATDDDSSQSESSSDSSDSDEDHLTTLIELDDTSRDASGLFDSDESESPTADESNAFPPRLIDRPPTPFEFETELPTEGGSQ
jgi:hypothetical protein